MEQLLKDIQQRIIAQVPALKYVDEDWGQLDFYAPHPPVQWPCSLIDIQAVNWSNTLKKVQMGLVQVKIRIADLRTSNSSGNAPQYQKDKSFAIFGLLKDVYKALQGWSGSNHYSKLIRSSNSRLKREDGVRIYEMIFTVELTDTSAMDARLTTMATPDIRES